jgi:hypothetical protein
MKRLVSGSSILPLTALMFTLSFGCGETTEGDTGYAELAELQTTDGTCNAMVAKVIGTAQKCFRSRKCEFGSAECNLALSVLDELFNDPHCGPAILDDALNGFPTGNPISMPDGSSRPGEPKHMQVVFCSAISDCGACGALPPDFCPGIC